MADRNPTVHKFNMKDANWVMTPEFGGGEAVFYRSPDGRRVVAAWRESGKHTFEYTFDEFVYVLEGSAKASIRGGDTLIFEKGDIIYVEEGTVIDFEMSDDFEDITVLVSDKPVRWR